MRMDGYFSIFGLPGAFVLTCLMSLYAAVLAVICRRTDRTLCMFAMLVSTAGDIVMMDFRGMTDGWKLPPMYVGAALFMIAHVLYSAAFVVRIVREKYQFANFGLWIALAIAAAAGASIVYLFRHSGAGDTAMLAVALCYLAVISAALICVFSYAASAEGWRMIAAVGELSFFVSDYIIGLSALGGISDFSGLIWWFYPIGQILLITGA